MGRQRHHHNQCQQRAQPVENVQQVFSLLYQPVNLLPAERVRIALFMLGDLADARIEKARKLLASYDTDQREAVARLLSDARRSGAEHQGEDIHWPTLTELDQDLPTPEPAPDVKRALEILRTTIEWGSLATPGANRSEIIALLKRLGVEGVPDA